MGLKSVSDVSSVILNENNEKMVSIGEDKPNNLLVFSKAYRDGKEGSIEEVLIREGAKGKLFDAASRLPKGYKLVAWETYTPRSLQEGIRGKLTDLKGISHMTGGAVDVSLADEDGNLLEMGTDLNHGTPENKSTLYFEEKEALTENEMIIRENRRILFQAMSEAGFINNPLAWFHWDYGNLWWAKATDNEAFYGPVDQ